VIAFVIVVLMALCFTKKIVLLTIQRLTTPWRRRRVEAAA